MSLGVTAIILAAGRSRRMGDVNKLLADWRGKRVVQHVVAGALQSRAKEVLVVTGHQAADIKQALTDYPVRFVENENFAQGLSSSLKAGVGALGTDVSGAAILLADMPDLQTDTLNILIETFQEKQGDAITVPVCEGRGGNPVIWPRVFFPEILKLRGDRGARDLMEKYLLQVTEVPCDDRGVLRDIDIPDDLAGNA